MIADRIGTDTQVVLLLTAALGKRSDADAKPLSSSEYSALAEALQKLKLRPAQLLGNTSAGAIEALLIEMPTGKRGRIAADRVSRLLERGGLLSIALTRWIGAGLWVVSRADPEYPSRYKRVLKGSSPPIVFGIGPQSLLGYGGLAVVGSRKPEPSSAEYAEAAGRWAATAGMQVVSGAARGVDELSMLACANSGGTSLGVVAESLLQQSTRKKYRDLIVGGQVTLISSFDPEAPFNVGNAMARNRWIYALADRGLVVACSEESGGTWAGAIEALRLGFPLYARRGNPDRPGNEALIRRGAWPIDDEFDVLLRDRTPPLISAIVVNDAPAAVSLADAAMETIPEKIFGAVAPVLLEVLRDPVTAKEVAKRTGLSQPIVDRWLKLLIAEQRAIKIKTGYQAVHPQHSMNAQPSLFVLLRDRTPPLISATVVNDAPTAVGLADTAMETIPEKIFGAVAPVLLEVLRDPVTAKDVAERTGLSKPIVDRWLKLLVAEQRAIKIQTRYQAVHPQHSMNAQPSLFSGS
jgi:predicted Rossmann fold nucleotide-binding protein DprA/Smf involved in DNA uptake